MFLNLHLYLSFVDRLKFTACHIWAGHVESSLKEHCIYITIIFWLSQSTLLTVSLFS